MNTGEILINVARILSIIGIIGSLYVIISSIIVYFDEK